MLLCHITSASLKLLPFPQQDASNEENFDIANMLQICYSINSHAKQIPKINWSIVFKRNLASFQTS